MFILQSAQYKKDKEENLDHIIELAEKIAEKINQF